MTAPARTKIQKPKSNGGHLQIKQPTSGSVSYTHLDVYKRQVNNRLEPDLVAPAVNVFGPLPGGRFGTRTGTSVAAAHTAGASALLLEWGVLKGNVPYMNTSDVKEYLIRGATRSPERTYPNREWGYGALNLYNTFEAIIPRL